MYHHITHGMKQDEYFNEESKELQSGRNLKIEALGQVYTIHSKDA